MNAAVAVPVSIRGRSFTSFAWGVLAWNVLVVLWGAYVRASGSGAGCGNHWPLCNGEVVPRAPEIATIIEFTHRLMSGVAFFGVAALAWWSLRLFPRGHRGRRMAIASLVFLILEALLGAGLVLFDYVGGNNSVGRALYLSLHLVNTQLLLGSLTLAAWYSREEHQLPRSIPRVVAAALPIALLVSVMGAIAALGDTLFPATSLREGLRQDFSGTAHFLLRLRIFHPALAVFAGGLFVATAVWSMKERRSDASRMIAFVIIGVTLLQLIAGVINIALLAPVWMQILHLLIADLLWISLVLFSVESGIRPLMRPAILK